MLAAGSFPEELLLAHRSVWLSAGPFGQSGGHPGMGARLTLPVPAFAKHVPITGRTSV